MMLRFWSIGLLIYVALNILLLSCETTVSATSNRHKRQTSNLFNNKVLNNGKYSLIKKDSTRVDIPVGSNGDYLFVGKGPGSSNAAGVGYNSGSHNVHAFYSPGGTVGVSYTFKFGGGGKKRKCKGGRPGQPGTDESNPRPATGQPGME